MIEEFFWLLGRVSIRPFARYSCSRPAIAGRLSYRRTTSMLGLNPQPQQDRGSRTGVLESSCCASLGWLSCEMEVGIFRQDKGTNPPSSWRYWIRETQLPMRLSARQGKPEPLQCDLPHPGTTPVSADQTTAGEPYSLVADNPLHR